MEHRVGGKGSLTDPGRPAYSPLHGLQHLELGGAGGESLTLGALGILVALLNG